MLLGYEAMRGCYAGFDIYKHLTFTPGSPSIQVRISVLDEARRNGIAFGRKGNAEIAVGFRTDYLLAYTLHSTILHEQGIDSATFALLTKLARQEAVEPQEIKVITPERQRVISEVARFTRAASFRRRIVDAYASTCAVTQMRLRLVDAAHILPVGAEGSTDETGNGLCLSPTFHRAFDAALIFLDEGYVMHLNREKAAELDRQGLGAGLDLIIAHLEKQIVLPRERGLWPDPRMIRSANEFRQIETSAP